MKENFKIDFTVNKQQLRSRYKQKRENLSSVEKNSLHENIYQQIYELDISEVKIIHIFLSLEKFNEINTVPIIDYFRTKNIKIVVPKTNFKNNSLTHFYLEEDTELEINHYGIPEPKDAIQAPENAIDLVFVPLLISDKNHHRIGYGKGFYDRFLSICRPNCIKIGLNFFKPISEIKDIDEFDIALDLVLYPK